MKGIKTPTNFIQWMWKSGHFQNEKSLWDIEKFAISEGYTFNKPAIMMALKRSKYVTSIGKLSNGVPLFRQIRPPNSEEDYFEGSTVPKYVDVFKSLDIHPEIRRVSEKLFLTGNYMHAILEAFKKVNNMVKKKSGIDDDGKSLMNRVFSVNNPVLSLSRFDGRTRKNEQEGFMHLFEGSMQAIRNPKAHEEIFQDDPFKTIEYLCLASILAKLVDSSKKM